MLINITTNKVDMWQGVTLSLFGRCFIVFNANHNF